MLVTRETGRKGVLHQVVHQLVHTLPEWCGRPSTVRWTERSAARDQSQARGIRQSPALVGTQLETRVRILRQEEVPVEIHPVGERGHDGRGRDRDRGLLHAAEERL